MTILNITTIFPAHPSQNSIKLKTQPLFFAHILYSCTQKKNMKTPTRIYYLFAHKISIHVIFSLNQNLISPGSTLPYHLHLLPHHCHHLVPWDPCHLPPSRGGRRGHRAHAWDEHRQHPVDWKLGDGEMKSFRFWGMDFCSKIFLLSFIVSFEDRK